MAAALPAASVFRANNKVCQLLRNKGYFGVDVLLLSGASNPGRVYICLKGVKAYVRDANCESSCQEKNETLIGFLVECYL